MNHSMTIKVYRQRPGEPPSPVVARATVRVDPDAVTRCELERQHCSTAWGPCRCPRHRQEAAT
ncbi:hypothetical protein [Streptomyces sp. NPDC057702]|uniref:hypothetical protein n=1 Tax=unclassified Streptomyces TaxID=2593676 RepID=UPI0036C82FB4